MAAFRWQTSDVDVFRNDGDLAGCGKAAAKHQAAADLLVQQMNVLGLAEDDRLREMLRVARICAGCDGNAWDACRDLPGLGREMGATPEERDEWETKAPPPKKGAARTRERASMIKGIGALLERIPARCGLHPGAMDDDLREKGYEFEARASSLVPPDDNLTEAAEMVRGCAECSRNQRIYCGRAGVALERAREEPDGRSYRAVWE